ncbi:MAG TPA: hypothetical protein VMV45_18690, partial [Casimicrobiaceae bacterium]|nr:hypothetical protein [Casimicrobiaceae bacterium]
EKECKNTNCPDINVSVANGQISVDADTMKIRKNNPKVQLMWKLDPHGDYEFHDNSIQFKDPQAASRQFRFKNQNGQLIHYEDENSDRNDYGYTIVVFDKKTQQPLSKDPIIANQGF